VNQRVDNVGRQQPHQRPVRATTVLAVLAVGVILYIAQDAFIPVAMALFLALLLSPAVDRLHRWRVPRGLAVAIVMLAVLLAGAGAVNAVWNPAIDWLEGAPQTLRNIERRVRPLRAVIARLEEVTQRAERLAQGGMAAQNVKAAVPAWTDESGSALTITKSVVQALTVIPLTLFFLIGGPPLFACMGAFLSGSETSANALRLTQAIRLEVSRYFATITLINLGLGAATTAVVAALGMPNAILWGMIAAVLNFIPYLGPVTTIVILGGAALATFDELARALAVPGSFVLLHLIEGQLVQPLTVGHRLKVNALVILLAVWFGFWFWGIPGVFLAVPALVALKVAAEHESSWHVVRNFLAPNEKGPLRMRERLRKTGEQPAMHFKLPFQSSAELGRGDRTVRRRAYRRSGGTEEASDSDERTV
jgi:predicted PurR-regulated permease PerM